MFPLAACQEDPVSPPPPPDGGPPPPDGGQPPPDWEDPPDLTGCVDLTKLPTCSEDGWCWVDPLPQGFRIQSMHGIAPNDMWAAARAVLHWDGKYLRRTYFDPAMDFQGVFETGPHEVWATGKSTRESGVGAIVRLRDGVPETMRATPWYVISGTGQNDLWFGGASKTSHWDGSKFTDFAIPDDGTALSLDATGEQPWLVAAHAIVPRGTYTRLYSFSNERWVPRSEVPFNPSAVHVFPPNEVWVSTQDGVGKLGSPLIHANVPFYGYGAIQGASSKDFWVTGRDDSSARTMLHFDGTSLQPYAYPGASSPTSMFFGGPGWGYVGDGRGELLRLRRESFVPVTRPPMPSIFGEIWGTGPNDIYIVGEISALSRRGVAIHWDGCQWKEVDFGLGPLGEFSDVWGKGDEIWIVGHDAQKGFLLHKDASGKWTRLATPQDAPYESVWGAASNDVWFGGPTFMHWNGSTFETVPKPSGSSSFGELTGSGSDDIWAIARSQDAPLYHYDGHAWTQQVEKYIELVAPVAKNDVWGWSGFRRTLQHFDGRKWTPVELPNDDPKRDVFGIWANGPNDVWIGEQLHWDGTAVRAVNSDTDAHRMWGDGKNTWSLLSGGIRVRRGPGNTSR
ncbi:hypothetical protein LZC95_15485 [Pendulispora brunnea]|uniref:Uncharacterized protein n=1 Tax=Pendulispora brunnea TaxID=2905690 RepID=A0ABZ2KI38_9BACT